MRLRQRIALVTVLLTAAGCSGKTQTEPLMSDSTFVEVMTDLVKLRNRPDTDTTTFPARRRQALESRKVTLDELEKKSLFLADDPALATKLWDKVRMKLGPRGG